MPDIVTLQENVTEPFAGLVPPVIIGPLDNTVLLLRDRLAQLASRCGFRYEVVFDPEGATGPPAAPGTLPGLERRARAATAIRRARPMLRAGCMTTTQAACADEGGMTTSA
jgi:hypothetical protein